MDTLRDNTQTPHHFNNTNTTESHNTNPSTHIPMNFPTLMHQTTSISTATSDTIDEQFLPSLTSRWDSDSNSDDTKEWSFLKTHEHKEYQQETPQPKLAHQQHQVETLSPKHATLYRHHGCPSIHSWPQQFENIPEIDPTQTYNQSLENHPALISTSRTHHTQVKRWYQHKSWHDHPHSHTFP